MMQLTEKRKILIVDDKQENLSLLSTVLESKGYNVRKAINGEIAITGAARIQPHLILLDINMPGLDGYEVCRMLKNNDETRDIPVIFLTVSDQVLDKVKGFELGCVDYITKPFDVQEVLCRVEHHVNFYQENIKLKKTKNFLTNQVELERLNKEKVTFLMETFNEIIRCNNFDLALYTTLTYICEFITWDFGEIWFPNIDSNSLEYGYICYGDKPDILKHFPNSIDPYVLNQYIRLPLKVWQTKEIQWIDDIFGAINKNSNYEKLHNLNQIRSTIGIPIIADEAVIAIIVFCNKKNISYNKNLVAIIKEVIEDLSQVIRQKQIETHLRQTNHRLKNLANLDTLTKIANRRQFDESLMQQWQKLKSLKLPLSLILCDVDSFKLYNDTYGHLAGDECLRKVAMVISRTINNYHKRPGGLVARYGGEEFALILPNTSAREAFELAELIRQKVENLKIIHESSTIGKHVTLSLGVVTVIPSKDYSPLDVLDCADQGLYLAKSQGRNRTSQYHV